MKSCAKDKPLPVQAPRCCFSSAPSKPTGRDAHPHQARLQCRSTQGTRHRLPQRPAECHSSGYSRGMLLPLILLALPYPADSVPERDRPDNHASRSSLSVSWDTLEARRVLLMQRQRELSTRLAVSFLWSISHCHCAASTTQRHAGRHIDVETDRPLTLYPRSFTQLNQSIFTPALLL